MRITIGADHAGSQLKENLKSYRQGVEHDDMNVFVMGGRVIGEEVAHEPVRAFLRAKFTRDERHLRRLAKVQAIERRCLRKGQNGRAEASRRLSH